MSMKRTEDYAALAEAEISDAWDEASHGDDSAADLSLHTAVVYAQLAIAAATLAQR